MFATKLTEYARYPAEVALSLTVVPLTLCIHLLSTNGLMIRLMSLVWMSYQDQHQPLQSKSHGMIWNDMERTKAQNAFRLKF